MDSFYLTYITWFLFQIKFLINIQNVSRKRYRNPLRKVESLNLLCWMLYRRKLNRCFFFSGRRTIGEKLNHCFFSDGCCIGERLNLCFFFSGRRGIDERLNHCFFSGGCYIGERLNRCFFSPIDAFSAKGWIIVSSPVEAISSPAELQTCSGEMTS